MVHERKSVPLLHEHLIVEGHRDVEDGQKINIIKTISDVGEMSL